MKRRDHSTVAFLAFLVLINLGIRLAAVSRAAMPLNDGGLFYKMIMDLLANGLRLPAYFAYNGFSIPFAYPPLPFFIYGAVQLATRVSLIDLVQYGPPVVSAAAIPAFFFLADSILHSRTQAGMATLVFSFLPREFEWLIMGGGVTRGLGLLFALLAIRQAYLLVTSRSRKHILPMMVFGALVVCTHPEAATHTALSAALFFIWRGRTRRGFGNATLVLLGMLALTAPWWAVVMLRHGLEPFRAAATAARADSYSILAGLVQLFRFDFADEPFISIFTVLGLLGLMLKIARREYLLPAWLLVLHTFEPRGGALFIMIPLSMGAGFALVEMVLKNLQEASSRPSEAFPTGQAGAEQWLPTLMQNQATRWLVGFLVVYGSMAAFFTAWRVQQQFTLTKDDLSSFNWVLDNTSPAAQFALVTQGLPLRDASSEWFPSLTRRRSLATVFGLEWIPDADFAEALTKYRTLQACAQQGSPCLETWIGQHSADLDYVYIRDPIDVGRLALSRSLADAPDYSRVYVSNTVVVYKRR